MLFLKGFLGESVLQHFAKRKNQRMLANNSIILSRLLGPVAEIVCRRTGRVSRIATSCLPNDLSEIFLPVGETRIGDLNLEFVQRLREHRFEVLIQARKKRKETRKERKQIIMTEEEHKKASMLPEGLRKKLFGF